MKNLFSIEGKIALITGGSRGIGLMMARGFVENGAKVYISSRKAQVCHQVAEELSKLGTCIALPADISNEAGVLSLIEALKQKEQKLDILVNNAGIAWEEPFDSFPDSAWDRIFAVNVKSIFTITRGLVPLLEAAGNHEDPSRVINIGSIAALVSHSMNTYSYGPSKAAVHHLTQMLARELAEKHIAVNAIAPGRFPSRMTKLLIEDEEASKAELETIPFQRFGKPEDIAGLAIFLASRASAFITGSIIKLDGGQSIAGV